MRFSVLVVLLLSAAASLSVSAATADNENQRSHHLLRRRSLLNDQQVSLKVNLAANLKLKRLNFVLTYPLVID
jgi:hypothetical protein